MIPVVFADTFEQFILKSYSQQAPQTPLSKKIFESYAMESWMSSAFKEAAREFWTDNELVISNC